MTSTLLPNILSYIGTFIDKKDRLACALVCKHWTEPFLNAYWGKLKIGYNGMDINTLISSKSLLINAHRVWAVRFTLRRLDDYEGSSKLQQFFPKLRYFEFYATFSDISAISEEFDWSLWKSLTHLNLTSKYESETTSFQSLSMKLSVLPCLVHLAFVQSKQPPFSWNDFESLHKHLPRLEYLKHNVVFKPIKRDEIESIRAVEPAQTMTKVEFNKKFNTHWLFYFALKYPNLQHFIISQSFGRYNKKQIDYNRQQHQSDLQLLSTLDQFFPCLKKAVTTFENERMYLWFIFFETLGHFGTKIEHVDLNYASPIKNDDPNRYIQPISESLKVLKINLYTREAMSFDVCLRLVTLCIDGVYRPIIEVDAILECFPALRSLSVSNIEFSLSTNPHTYTPHPLQRLTIEYSDVNNDTLHYLSLRCNQLKYVTMTGIGYYKVDETGQLIFDMSVTKLDTFIFTFRRDFVFTAPDLHRHYMIEQMENDNNGLQAAQQPSRINWYHICCDRTNRKPKVLKWELGRHDIEFCQRYFKDFDRRKKRGKERKDIKQHPHGFVQRRFWKKDLQHGVLIFRFKSVKNHFFHIESSYSSIKF